MVELFENVKLKCLFVHPADILRRHSDSSISNAFPSLQYHLLASLLNIDDVT